MRNERHLAGNDRRQAVIHDLQMQALQVWDVPGDVKGHDLASATGKELVPAGEPFEDRAALRRSVLVADNIRICFKVAYSDRQGGYGLPFISETGAMLSSFRMRGCRSVVEGGSIMALQH